MINRTRLVAILFAAVLVAGAVGVAVGLAPSQPNTAGSAGPAVGEAAWYRTDADIKVYKTATCGCCSSWVEHLRRNGFEVEAVDVEQDALNGMKQAVGLTRELAACHTAFIDGYVVEGHVPAADIQRLVRERPAASGVTVPGMPLGSPGMAYEGRRQPYEVLTFGGEAGTAPFATHHP